MKKPGFGGVLPTPPPAVVDVSISLRELGLETNQDDGTLLDLPVVVYVVTDNGAFYVPVEKNCADTLTMVRRCNLGGTHDREVVVLTVYRHEGTGS